MGKRSFISGVKKWFKSRRREQEPKSDTVSTDRIEDNFNQSAIIKWDGRIAFVLYAVGYTVGLGKVWRFPYKVYSNGRGSFLLAYTIVCFCLGFPLLILEFGLGQFSGRDCTNAFRMVPLFGGIGWSMLFLSTIVTIYFSVITSWGYFYMFSTLAKSMPWNTCNGDYNSFKCMPSHILQTATNETGISSAKEFFEHYIVRFKDPETNMHPLLSIMEWANLTLIGSLMFAFFVPVFINVFGKRITGRILYFTVVYPYCIILTFLLRTLTMPGSLEGIIYYITPSWKSLLDINTFLEAFEQLFFSLGLGMGTMITLARYNYFNGNFVTDTLTIVLIDYFSCLFFGLAMFTTLGCFSFRFDLNIGNIVKSEWEFLFVAYPVTFCQVFGDIMWNIAFMFMLVCLGFDAQMVYLEAVTTSLHESFPLFRKTFVSNFILELVISFTLFVASLLLLGPGGVYWMRIVLEPVMTSLAAILILFEIVTLSWIYGYKTLTRDYRMMLQAEILKGWVVFYTILAPTLLIIFAVGSTINYSKFRIDGVGFPWWAEVMTVSLIVVVLFPILVVMVNVMSYYKKELPNLKIMDLLKQSLKPYSDWGPYDKRDWMLSIRYKSKLLNRLEDSTKKQSVTESEHFNDILRESQIDRTI